MRKREYGRVQGKPRTFIKGQKYTLLAHPQNLTGSARKNLKLLLAANKRLNTAYRPRRTSTAKSVLLSATRNEADESCLVFEGSSALCAA